MSDTVTFDKLRSTMRSEFGRNMSSADTKEFVKSFGLSEDTASSIRQATTQKGDNEGNFVSKLFGWDNDANTNKLANLIKDNIEDKDDDGEYSKEEIKAALEKIAEDQEEENTGKTSFEKADYNDDGKVTRADMNNIVEDELGLKNANRMTKLDEEELLAVADRLGLDKSSVRDFFDENENDGEIRLGSLYKKLELGAGLANGKRLDEDEYKSAFKDIGIDFA